MSTVLTGTQVDEDSVQFSLTSRQKTVVEVWSEGTRTILHVRAEMFLSEVATSMLPS